MHRIIKAMRGRAIRPTLVLVLVLLALPAVARACESWTPPPGCHNGQNEQECLQGIRNKANEEGILTSGIEAARIRAAEEHFQACEKYEKEVAEIHERGERERAEAIRTYEERLHEIAEQQKREEQQQAEAKYAREHPTPPPTPPPAPVPTPPSITAFASSSGVKLSSGTGTITAGCGAASNETCTFALTLVATVHGAHTSAVKHVTVGTVTGNVQGGKSGKLTVKLNSRGRGYLKHNSLHLEATGTVKSTAGLVTKISRHLTIKKK